MPVGGHCGLKRAVPAERTVHHASRILFFYFADEHFHPLHHQSETESSLMYVQA